MIWNSIYTVVISVLLGFIGLFPNVDSAVITRINGSLSPFKSYLANADWFFPVGDFFSIVGIVLVIESGIILIKVLHWLLKNVSLGFIK